MEGITNDKEILKALAARLFPGLKEMVKDPAFQKDFEEWKRKREDK